MKKNRPYSHIKSQKERRKKDYNICQFCGSQEKVASHHIFEYSKGGPDLVESMITLCESCHIRMIHKYPEIRIIKVENSIKVIGHGGK
jgi:5-methylcytosine-specific restriction endonuclease McrA